MLRLAATLCAVALLVPSTAAADPPADDTRVLGGCEWHAVDDAEPDSLTPPDTFVGTVSAAVVAYARSGRHNPVTVVDLRCELWVVDQLVDTYHGTGIGPIGVLAPRPVQHVVPEDAVAGLCRVVTTRDAHGNVATHDDPYCFSIPAGPTIPRPVIDLIDDALTLASDVTDSLLCGALARLAPGAGPVEVRDDGDVYAAGELVWDCPPYADGRVLESPA